MSARARGASAVVVTPSCPGRGNAHQQCWCRVSWPLPSSWGSSSTASRPRPLREVPASIGPARNSLRVWWRGGPCRGRGSHLLVTGASASSPSSCSVWPPRLCRARPEPIGVRDRGATNTKLVDVDDLARALVLIREPATWGAARGRPRGNVRQLRSGVHGGYWRRLVGTGPNKIAQPRQLDRLQHRLGVADTRGGSPFRRAGHPLRHSARSCRRYGLAPRARTPRIPRVAAAGAHQSGGRSIGPRRRRCGPGPTPADSSEASGRARGRGRGVGRSARSSAHGRCLGPRGPPRCWYGTGPVGRGQPSVDAR